MTDEAHATGEEQLILRDIRALLDQLQLDRDHSLTMQSRLTEDLGVDSLALVELCDQFERTFDVSLPDEVFLSAATPQQWLAAINIARGGDATVEDSERSSDATKRVSSSGTARIIANLKRLRAMVRAGREIYGPHVRRPASVGSSGGVGSLLYALYAWGLLIPFALAIWLLAVLPLTLTRRRSAGRAIARTTCRALGLSVNVEGELPTGSRPSVIAANHSSFIDGLMLYVFLAWIHRAGEAVGKFEAETSGSVVVFRGSGVCSSSGRVESPSRSSL